MVSRGSRPLRDTSSTTASGTGPAATQASECARAVCLRQTLHLRMVRVGVRMVPGLDEFAALLPDLPGEEEGQRGTDRRDRHGDLPQRGHGRGPQDAAGELELQAEEPAEGQTYRDGLPGTAIPERDDDEARQRHHRTDAKMIRAPAASTTRTRRSTISNSHASDRSAVAAQFRCTANPGTNRLSATSATGFLEVELASSAASRQTRLSVSEAGTDGCGRRAALGRPVSLRLCGIGSPAAGWRREFWLSAAGVSGVGEGHAEEDGEGCARGDQRCGEGQWHAAAVRAAVPMSRRRESRLKTTCSNLMRPTA